MNKAVFLDRDGTINIEKNYLYKVEDFEFIPGAIEGMRMLQEAGFILVIVTNQSGIARGYYTEDDFAVLNSWMIDELRENGVDITAIYYCPHLPNATIKKYSANCDCRKPLTGMYERAVNDYDIDLSQSYAIGDKIRDCEVCNKTQCRGFLVGENESDDIIEQTKNGALVGIEYATDLLEAARKIIGA